ncbi:hypothetical protein [Chryseobacterium sp. 52]|uniref:hypothetical protein n=1 Tax=Chryseobacterium sp. 52 TaxID=2035213 RepID=UPI0015D496E8|nr:hypothetical protein [Chryseobacterium sp. 52]
MKNLVILFLCLTANICFGQDVREFREPFTLKLAVDSVRFYQQEVPKSKYFVKDAALQIYPGEHIFVEAETKDGIIESMKVVKENKNPSKTIEIEFSQNAEGRKNTGMTLEVSNPFGKMLKYKAMMYIVGKNEWIETSVIPVRPKLKSFEMWNDVIITLVLDQWKLEK